MVYPCLMSNPHRHGPNACYVQFGLPGKDAFHKLLEIHILVFDVEGKSMNTFCTCGRFRKCVKVLPLIVRLRLDTLHGWRQKPWPPVGHPR